MSGRHCRRTCASGFRRACFTDDVANACKGQNGGAHDAGENALLALQRKMPGVWLGTTGGCETDLASVPCLRRPGLDDPTGAAADRDPAGVSLDR